MSVHKGIAPCEHSFSLIRPFAAATMDLLFPNGVEEKIGLWYDAIDRLKEKL